MRIEIAPDEILTYLESWYEEGRLTMIEYLSIKHAIEEQGKSNRLWYFVKGVIVGVFCCALFLCINH